MVAVNRYKGNLNYIPRASLYLFINTKTDEPLFVEWKTIFFKKGGTAWKSRPFRKEYGFTYY
ncbi:hypothetical protein JCM9157_1087 [Halalkalibacter akibai JCM 9157]|uniref:Uncharacterized protein n=1 Tax=Halalkalibacter akibai (strain ATCC 43226 / DSM 21942 / CIP 109018 / JCM 9157 / 1139) TaxID=1236973 RepID=W4QPM3_HALA3|nr:hypothetical protein JCM9157_1087 [Halalkalibacter akibai JCM 9157]